MPKLKFVSLTCHRPDDAGKADDRSLDMTVEDEAYLVANNIRVWGVKRMSANDVADLSEVPPIDFNKMIRVELWDKDPSFFGRQDDQIGALTIRDDQAGIGELSQELKRGAAKYTLTYKVE